MLKVDRISVMNMENAIRGARNPMNSWAKMDSYYDEKGNFVLGENDLSLAHRLAVAGSDHRKFLRQIIVSMDIDAPFYWWRNLIPIRSVPLPIPAQQCIEYTQKRLREPISPATE